jgi:hypothetical protein
MITARNVAPATLSRPSRETASSVESRSTRSTMYLMKSGSIISNPARTNASTKTTTTAV